MLIKIVQIIDLMTQMSCGCTILFVIRSNSLVQAKSHRHQADYE